MTASMDRDELIARAIEHAESYDTPKADDARRRYTPAQLEIAVRHALDALESRPTPTEERILAAAKAAWRADMIDAADQRAQSIHDGFDFEWGWKELATMPLSGSGFVRQWTTIAKAALATDTTPSRSLIEAVERFLADYDDDDRADAGCGTLMELHVADFRAALAAPSRDEEGSVDREAVIEGVARHIEQLEPLITFGPPDGISIISATRANVTRAIRALKASTPETQTVDGGGR